MRVLCIGGGLQGEVLLLSSNSPGFQYTEVDGLVQYTRKRWARRHLDR